MQAVYYYKCNCFCSLGDCANMPIIASASNSYFNGGGGGGGEVEVVEEEDIWISTCMILNSLQIANFLTLSLKNAPPPLYLSN